MSKTPYWLFADPRALFELARDLERIERGEGPSANDLDDAPILIDWKLHTTRVPGLIGLGMNHPVLENGPIVTSPLFAVDRNGQWARTRSRWYRLVSKADIKHQ